jgi:hypothetical protein
MMTRAHDTVARHLRATERRRSGDMRVRRQWNYGLSRGRHWLDVELHDGHRRLRQSIPRFLRASSMTNLLSAPIIYSLSVPFVLLDLWVSLYQWICFPIYGIAVVSRRQYFVIDRHKLDYLNAIEKVHCAYCSYVNGLIAYTREIAACTEQYWCPIRHAGPIRGGHDRYTFFADYGDAVGYRHGLTALRRELRPGKRSRRRPAPRLRPI